eukprot:6536499-Pyramimonas_sp.AAC.1
MWEEEVEWRFRSRFVGARGSAKWRGMCLVALADWLSVHPATVPGLWIRGLLMARRDVVGGLRGASVGRLDAR